MTMLFAVDVSRSDKKIASQYPFTALVTVCENRAMYGVVDTALEDWLIENMSGTVGRRARPRWSALYARVYFVYEADAMLFRMTWHGIELPSKPVG